MCSCPSLSASTFLRLWLSRESACVTGNVIDVESVPEVITIATTAAS